MANKVVYCTFAPTPSPPRLQPRKNIHAAVLHRMLPMIASLLVFAMLMFAILLCFPQLLVPVPLYLLSLLFTICCQHSPCCSGSPCCQCWRVLVSCGACCRCACYGGSACSCRRPYVLLPLLTMLLVLLSLCHAAVLVG